MRTLLLTMISIALACSSVICDSIKCHISFVDDPPYESSWLPWSADHFRIAIEMQNVSDSTIAVRRSQPCYDCNPVLMIRELHSGLEPDICSKVDILYLFDNDSTFIDLPPGESHADTIDFAKYVTFSLIRDTEYVVWVVWKEATTEYSFKDTNRVAPIWPSKIVSDSLTFIY